METKKDTGYINYAARLSGDVLRFSHDSMNTIFEVFAVHEDAGYAEQAAHEAFRELDRLEQELSRFIENSDISRINSAGANYPVRVGLETFECLEQCAKLSAKTGNAFDITIGPLLSCRQKKDKTPRTPTERELTFARIICGIEHVHLDSIQYTVELKKDNMIIDLGGFGKGYALDRMGEILRKWGINSALIHGGFSSVLALDAPPGEKGWLLTLKNPGDYSQEISSLYLTNRSVSGSGVRKGSHIIDPRTGYSVEGKIAAWAICPAAAESDALSTAFMNMSAKEIDKYCKSNSDTQAIIIPDENEGQEKLCFGDFEDFL